MNLVVGSGPTGVMAARALTDAGLPVTMLDVGRELEPERRALVERLRTVSVPGAAALAGLRALEAVGLRAGFKSDSLLGLLNPDPAPDSSSARRLGLGFRPFAAGQNL